MRPRRTRRCRRRERSVVRPSVVETDASRPHTYREGPAALLMRSTLAPSCPRPARTAAHRPWNQASSGLVVHVGLPNPLAARVRAGGVGTASAIPACGRAGGGVSESASQIVERLRVAHCDAKDSADSRIRGPACRACQRVASVPARCRHVAERRRPLDDCDEAATNTYADSAARRTARHVKCLSERRASDDRCGGAGRVSA